MWGRSDMMMMMTSDMMTSDMMTSAYVPLWLQLSVIQVQFEDYTTVL